jgi:hypothetical protein
VQRVATAAGVWQVLTRARLLLLQDRCLPSVMTLLAGEPLQTSWWSHPGSRRLFRILGELTAHPDVILTQLVLGQDTFVHRELWPALLAVVRVRARWQSAQLPAIERRRCRVRTIAARWP